MDHPPGANRAAWQLQIAVRPEAPGWRPGRPPADESSPVGEPGKRHHTGATSL